VTSDRQAVTRHTERLVLRQWREEDLEPFAQLNADPEVMRYFPAPLDREQSDAMVTRMRERIEVQGWGLWAVERRDTGAMVGFTGLAVPRHPLPFQPCVEVGWRLARGAWGHGSPTRGRAPSWNDWGWCGNRPRTSTTRRSPRAIPCAGTSCIGRSGGERATLVVGAKVVHEDVADELGLGRVLGVDGGEEVLDVGGGAVVRQVGAQGVVGGAGLAALAKLVLDIGPDG
jgi:hypothetical protein